MHPHKDALSESRIARLLALIPRSSDVEHFVE